MHNFGKLGSPRYPSGKVISYGININHCRTIYKNIFGIIGIGYFKQVWRKSMLPRVCSQLDFKEAFIAQ